MKRQKINYPKLSIAILSVLVVFFAGTALYFYKQAPNVTPEDPIDPFTYSDQIDFSIPPDTSKWKTYSNQKLNFSFQYPDSYTLIENPSKFPPGSPAGDVLIGEMGPNGIIGQSMIVKKVHSSIKSQFTNSFSWSLVNLQTIPTKYTSAFVLSYNTRSSDESRIYIFSNGGPSNPFDEGNTPMDILLAYVSGANDNPTHQKIFADNIAYTLHFLK